VEAETGADFAFSLFVKLKDIAVTQRHVLAQAKLIGNARIRVNCRQMDLLQQSGGGEFGLYAVWGQDILPFVVTVANMKGVIRACGETPKASQVERFGRALGDYVVEDFLGLWHGIDFYQEEYGETPPKQSPPVLYHLLHAGAPPPNVAHFGVFHASSVGASPGFYVQGMDIPEGTPIP